MKIRPVGAGFFNADGETDRHDEANSRFSQFCEKRLKTGEKSLGPNVTVHFNKASILCYVHSLRLWAVLTVED